MWFGKVVLLLLFWEGPLFVCVRRRACLFNYAVAIRSYSFGTEGRALVGLCWRKKGPCMFMLEEEGFGTEANSNFPCNNF